MQREFIILEILEPEYHCILINNRRPHDLSMALTCRALTTNYQWVKKHKAYLSNTISVSSTTAYSNICKNKVREKSRECHNHKPQPFQDPKRKRKLTNINKHKPNKRTKGTKISSLFPKRGNRNTKRTEKHKNKITHGKTYNKSSRRINHKATKSKTNTGTIALERTVGKANHRGV